EELNDHVEERVGARLDQGKRVGLVGGDHSTPLGFFRAQAKRHDQFGILHLDAHLDLRKAYEGFTHSHASILYNALALPQVAKVVSVGIRDFCLEEQQVVDREQGRVQVFHDAELQAQRFAGDTWQAQCDRIIAALPDKVHVTFDIDGLDPTLCPNTGTPVPGGLSFPQATYLLSRLADSGRKVIGFDLVEVSPGEDEWDGNVGARLLWHLCGVLWKAG
ncbi:MAG TPA: arginase family protein, partial [Flavobacteriales bacterium]|nr:arginase family protein [Flavobacteriales bacterium]